jgi:hypothetical protein
MFAENFIPIDVTRLDLTRGGVAAVASTFGTAQSESTLGEVQAIAHITTDAIEFFPLYKTGIDAALEDEIFDQTTDIIFGKCRHHSGAFAEAPTHTASDIVFAAAFPGLELAGGADATITGIETQHDFPEGNDIVGTFFSGFDY